MTQWLVVLELWGREEYRPGNMPWHHTSVQSNTHTHTYKVKVCTTRVQTQWFIYIKSMTQNRVLISMQNAPKSSNGRLWGEREESHIKGINQRHNFGSTWVIFHLNHIAKHLAFNTLVFLRRRLLLQLAGSPFTMSLTASLPQRWRRFSFLLHPSAWPAYWASAVGGKS